MIFFAALARSDRIFCLRAAFGPNDAKPIPPVQDLR